MDDNIEDLDEFREDIRRGMQMLGGAILGAVLCALAIVAYCGWVLLS